jgi:SAM-dependent methyltransferase
MTQPPKRTPSEVFGERASFYVDSPSHTDPASLSLLVELAQPQRRWRALDVGAGTGHTALALAPHVKYVVAADLTVPMLGAARKLQQQQGLSNIAWAAADAHELPFDEEAFDLVVCRRAAHHFIDLEQALDEMNAVLKPGGRLVIDDRSVPESDFVDTCMNKLDRYHDPSHVREYRVAEWEAMLRANGFCIDVIEPYERHRPLTSLTEGATVEDQYRIYTTLDRLNAYQRSALKLIEVEGVPHINHWYVLIAASRKG